MIRSFEQNNASMRPMGQHDKSLDGTHGRIKWREKSFYEMKKRLAKNLFCYRLDHIGELKNPYFARVSQSSKQLFLKGMMNVSSPSKKEL